MSIVARFVQANRRWCAAIDRRFPGFAQGPDSWIDLQARIQASLAADPANVLELGGADRPMLARSPRYRYVGLDIEESPRCRVVYDEFLVQSVEVPISSGVDGRGCGFDLIVSKTLLEHVPDNRASFRSMHDALAVGGVMHHMIPCRNHPYSWILRAIGPRMQKVVIRHLHPENADVTGFPTFFDHCSVSSLRRLIADTGFELDEMTPYYAATDYFRFFAPLYLVVRTFERLAERFGWTSFAALVVLTARRAGPVAALTLPGGDASRSPSRAGDSSHV